MPETHQNTRRPQIVVIGAGFGGLAAARSVAQGDVDVLLIDRNNYHGFWPLLYQVATAGLEVQQIATPVRAIVRKHPNIRFVLANVTSIDRSARIVNTDRGAFGYDELVVSAGSTTNFFGLKEVEQHAFQLKDVPDAAALRNQLIGSFEQAAVERDPWERKRLLTFAIVGGGPTGVELAGAIAELIRHVLRKDYPTLDVGEVNVVLIEAADRLLAAFPPALARRAQAKLTRMGVDVRLNTGVTGYSSGQLALKNSAALPVETVIWAAGVQGSELAGHLGVEVQRGNRVAVAPELHLPDDPNVWVIGDLAAVAGPDGKPYPQLATTAMQMGKVAGRNVLRKLRGQPLQQFRYFDKGTMATVGRNSAVARIWGLNWSGPIAWLLWLAVHLFYLIGFRNRLLVLVNWAYNYFTYDRGARALIAAPTREPEAQATTAEQLGTREQVRAG